MIQGEGSIFWDGIVSVVVGGGKKKVYMNMFPVQSVYRAIAVRICKYEIIADGNKER